MIESLLDMLCSEYDDNNEDEMPRLFANSPYYNNEDAVDLLVSKINNFSILSLNSQSLHSKYNQLRIYVEYFAQANFNFDIICLQETWINANHDISMFQLDDYVFIHQTSSCSAHGGVAYYIHHNLEYEVLSLNGTEGIWDGLFIEVNLRNNINNSKKKIVIGNVYRPPRETVDNYSTFIDDFDEILSAKLRSNSEVVITGDFNFDLLKIQNSTHVNSFFETMVTNGLIPKITLPTRISDFSATLIDNCFVKISSNFSETTAGILNCNISDHQPYFVTLDYLNYSQASSKYVKVYTNTDVAKNNFKLELVNTASIDKFHQSINIDPNLNYDILSKIIKDARIKHLPVKYVKFKKHRHRKSKWITQGIIRSIRFRDKLYSKLRSTPLTSPDYNKYKVNLQTYNRILAQNIRLAKKHYYYECFNKFQHDIKSTWGVIKEIINKSPKKNEMPNFFLINDLPENNPNVIVNKFNLYFTNIGPKLANSIVQPSNKSFEDYLRDSINRSFEFQLVNENTVMKAIEGLKPKSSCGVDNISNKLVKLIKNEIIKPLTLIINQSLQNGIFPREMKVAKILPLYKKNENYLFDNYRPVSLLPSLSKILETIMHNQLYNYFDKSNLFYDSQYGFRRRHSTELAAIEIVDRLVTQMDKNEIPINIYLDLSKAFDTLDHNILISKLQFYGLGGSSLQLLKDYITNRKQYVVFGRYESELKTISTGVPQGSILGPLLFIIYLNDIVTSTKIFKPIIYADDTALSATLNTLGNIDQNLESQINNELEKINIWLKVNKLSLNVNKTKAMLFHTPQKKVRNISLKLDDSEIEMVDNFNYLGIILDSHLSWKFHTSMISNKISRTNGIMRKLKKTIPPSALLLLYNSLILPHLNYGLLVWGLKSIKLLKLQKRSVRTIVDAKYNAHTEPIFKSLQLLKVTDLCALQELKFAYKLLNKTLPLYFLKKEYLRHSDIHNYETRASDSLQSFPARHAFVMNSICYRIPSILNECPILIKEKIFSHNIKGFAKYIKDFYITKYSIDCNIVHCYICQNDQ
jgi:endonuclease/exonuclease/phosphatase family metal-dependent hydrolase